MGLRHYMFWAHLVIGFRYIEFSDFPKCFLRLGLNPDVLGSNGLRIRLFREKRVYSAQLSTPALPDTRGEIMESAC